MARTPTPPVPVVLAPDSTEAMEGAAYRIRRAGSSERLKVAQRLVGQAASSAKMTAAERDAGRRFLDAAEAHGIDLSEMWFSSLPESDEPRQVCLLVPGSGRTGMAFSSSPRNGAEEAELSEVMERACQRSGKVRLAQALLDTELPSERAMLKAFERAGFGSVGTLAYMRRAVPAQGWRDGEASAEDGWPQEVRPRRYMPSDDALMLGLLDRTYIETKDCPELCGLRDSRDVLESHKAAGRFDPNLWWVLEYGDQPEGLLLLNPNPEMNSIELVYLGLAPVARKQGLARKLLVLGIERIAGRRERQITLAVDERNESALKLYESLGFERFARRAALVKPLGD